METESLLLFKNCSGFITYEQFAGVALARRITAAVCCAILFLILVVLVILAVVKKVQKKELEKLKLCGTVVKRLTTWLTAATVPYQLVLAIHSQPNSFPHDVCKTFGFLVQYFGSVQLLLTLGISMVLFFKVWDATPWKPECVDSCHKRTKECTFACCGCKINKLEVVFLVLVFGLPLLFDWIPFATNSYGAIGPWCWISSTSIEKNCTIHIAGLVEQIVLWDLPFGFVVLLTFVLFFTSLCLLGCTLKNSKAQNLIERVITDSVSSLFFLAVIFVFGVVEVITHAYLPVNKQNLGVWVVYAILTPLGGVFIPVALLTAIFLPLSLLTDKCTHGRRKKQGKVTLEKTTVQHNSDLYCQPSETVFEPSHEDLEDVPLVSDKQKQNYSSTA